MTGIRHTDVKDFFQKSCLSKPQSPDGDSPGGACGSASLRRHLHCFGFPSGNLADAPVRRNPVCLNPSHSVTAPY